MLEKYEIHDIPSFFFEGYESLAFIFSITNLKMFQAGSPWKGVVGGGGGVSHFLVWVSRSFARAFTIHFGHRGWIVHRFGALGATCPIWPHSWEKENTFPLPSGCAHKLEYVLFPPHLIPSKEVLSYLFKDPQINIFLGSHPPFLPNNNYNINNKPQSS